MSLEKKKHYSRFYASLAVFLAAGTLTLGNTAFAKVDMDLTEMSIEALMDIEVTSVSKKAQKLSESAAAIFAMTSEDIRRSGVTNIADALRMVPGLHVGRIDSSKWAVSSRGFNGRFANKLLVLIDGRSVYTPSFSGVYWEVQDTLLEDVERIEVIRGPGAALWGANAVNGVINIITKKAADTQGG
nr:TonB-dependent receptor [Desulfobacterales bacterium]